MKPTRLLEPLIIPKPGVILAVSNSTSTPLGRDEGVPGKPHAPFSRTPEEHDQLLFKEFSLAEVNQELAKKGLVHDLTKDQWGDVKRFFTEYPGNFPPFNPDTTLIIEAVSAGKDAGNHARIRINGVPVMMEPEDENPDARGLHIAVIC